MQLNEFQEHIIQKVLSELMEKKCTCDDKTSEKPCPVHGKKENISYKDHVDESVEDADDNCKCPAKGFNEECPVHGKNGKKAMEEKMSKSSLSKKIHKGEDVGKPGKNFDKLASKAGGGEKGKKIAAAAMWKHLANEYVPGDEEMDEPNEKFKSKKEDTKKKCAKCGKMQCECYTKEEKSLKTDNPCWKGYEPVGKKKKEGKTVPNCVPKESYTFSEKVTSPDKQLDKTSIKPVPSKTISNGKVEIEVMPHVSVPNDPEPPRNSAEAKATIDAASKATKFNNKKKLKKEEVTNEDKLLPKEKEKKEKFVKGMKQRYDDFKSKYGEKGKSVMYATATKMAKKED